jgi:HAD superfamily hydrolase (TIGR01509 family)
MADSSRAWHDLRSRVGRRLDHAAHSLAAARRWSAVMHRRVRGVILDVDGTLVNSNDAHARSWVTALDEAKISVSFEQVRKLIGMGGDKLLPALANVDATSALGERIAERRAEIFQREHLPKLHSFPKTRELLRSLRERGLRLTVASSAKGEELLPLLTLAGAEDLVESATSSSDAKRSKPDPDIVRAALAKLELAATDVFMIGDTPYDIEAARQTGIATIALRCGGRSDHDLAGAVAIYDSPADLLENLTESPLFR